MCTLAWASQRKFVVVEGACRAADMGQIQIAEAVKRTCRVVEGIWMQTVAGWMCVPAKASQSQLVDVERTCMVAKAS